MTNISEAIPYAKAEVHTGWIGRHRAGAATRMIAFAILALAGVGWRYLSTAVVGNSDLPDGGKYVLFVGCIGFSFEYVVSLMGIMQQKWHGSDTRAKWLATKDA